MNGDTPMSMGNLVVVESPAFCSAECSSLGSSGFRTLWNLHETTTFKL